MLDVEGDGGVLVVEEVAGELALGAGPLGGGVGLGVFRQAGCALAEEAQLVVGILAAMAHPAAEDEVEPGDPVGVELWGAGEEGLDAGGERRGEDFVGVEGKDPGVGAFVDGGVHLGAVALPGLGVDDAAEFAGDVEGAVSGAGVDEDEFVGPGDALKGAPEVGGFVAGEDGDGELGAGHGFGSGGGELLLNEGVYEGDEGLAGLGEEELAVHEVELEGGGEGGDPDLVDGGVGGDDELCGWLLKEDAEDAILLLDFEAAFLFGGEEVLLECFDGGVCGAAENEIVHGVWLPEGDKASVASVGWGGVGQSK